MSAIGVAGLLVSFDVYKSCTITVSRWLCSERSKVRRPPSTRFLMLPPRNYTTHIYVRARPITVDSSSLLAPRRVTSLSKTSTQEQRAKVVAEPDVQDTDSRSQSPTSAEKSQQSRPWTAIAGSSILDELASWRKLKEPLERYLEFVRCNHFGNADQTTDTQRLEDVSVATSTDKVGLSAHVGKIQQDDGRLLQRPRVEPRRISSQSTE